MSPSTAPPSCSFTRTARMVPLTRPQTVTSCAMMLPSICAPSPIRSSEARNSPLIRPKTCAGPLHSMSPTIDIPEPMQERVAAFVVGSPLAGGCSTTECFCCTALATTSATFAAVSFSFSGVLLLNISTSRFPPAFTAERRKLCSRNEHERIQGFYSSADTIASHSMYGALSELSLPNDSPIGTRSLAAVCSERALRNHLCARPSDWFPDHEGNGLRDLRRR